MSDLQGLRITGPLTGFVPGLAAALEGAGYTPVSARFQLRLVAHVSRWMSDRGLAVEGLGDSAAAEYLTFRRGVGYTCGKSMKVLAPLLDYPRSIGAAPAASVSAEPSEVEALPADYLGYLLGERGLTPDSARGYVDLVRPLLADHLHGRVSDLAGLDTAGVTGFVIGRSRQLAPKTAQRMTSALRSFLRCLAVHGMADPGLAQAVPKVANRSAPLPGALPPAEVAALVDSCDRTTVNGSRDYAVLVLLSRLGLRAGEVAALALEDVDWRHGEIAVTGKGGRHDRLPLPADVGAAVAAYLRDARPADAVGRHVFIRVKAPHRGLSPGGVTQIVAAAAARAGLGVVFAHRLRHSAATGMLRAGADLAGVGQVLRHRRPATTAIYARVDAEALRALARPWPGSAV